MNDFENAFEDAHWGMLLRMILRMHFWGCFCGFIFEDAFLG